MKKKKDTRGHGDELQNFWGKGAFKEQQRQVYLAVDKRMTKELAEELHQRWLEAKVRL